MEYRTLDRGVAREEGKEVTPPPWGDIALDWGVKRGGGQALPPTPEGGEICNQGKGASREEGRGVRQLRGQ